jgi:hypothetical protein
MSLNTAHANGGVLIHAGEWLVMCYIICLCFKETLMSIEFSRSDITLCDLVSTYHIKAVTILDNQIMTSFAYM